MTHAVRPGIHIIAASDINTDAITKALVDLGMGEDESVDYVNLYYGDKEDNDSASELIAEFAGRLCYKSFVAGLNQNVTKVREGNKPYLANVIKQKHGSVFEHASVSVLFTNVTRIFTHEMVRHRPGFAYSQESMRFVKLDDLPYRFPEILRDRDFTRRLFDTRLSNPQLGPVKQSFDDYHRSLNDFMEEAFKHIFQAAEEHLKSLNTLFATDVLDFELKKIVTSLLRRLVPDGVATNILVTGNHRAWRHVIETRSSRGAEEEIREIFVNLGTTFKDYFGNIYQDMQMNEYKELVFTNSKI